MQGSLCGIRVKLPRQKSGELHSARPAEPLGFKPSVVQLKGNNGDIFKIYEDYGRLNKP